MKAKSYILNGEITEKPNASQFQIIEEALPDIKDGEFLAEAKFLTVEPCLKIFVAPHEGGKGKIIGVEQVAKIIQSKNPEYPVGQYVVGYFGWRTLTVSDGSPDRIFGFRPRVVPDYGDLPRSAALGTLGTTGNTAYFGLLKICKPKKGDTVVVTSAAGSVGLIVGQLAKSLGCYVVGITGSDEKGERLVKEAGYDAYVNYKKENFEKKLAEATPNRIDCFFDNAGGPISSTIIDRLNKFARIAVCGSVSTYYNGSVVKAPEIQTPVKIHHARMEGFHVFRFVDQWDEGIEYNRNLIKEGKLKIFEFTNQGFENAPKAFFKLLSGENFGKTVVAL